MTKLDLMQEKLEKMAVLQELYDLASLSYKLKNEEMQLVLTERISSAKGEIADLERKVAEFEHENKAATAA